MALLDTKINAFLILITERVLILSEGLTQALFKNVLSFAKKVIAGHLNMGA